MAEGATVRTSSRLSSCTHMPLASGSAAASAVFPFSARSPSPAPATFGAPLLTHVVPHATVPPLPAPPPFASQGPAGDDYVFLSFAFVDVSVARSLGQALRELGVAVWLEWDNPKFAVFKKKPRHAPKAVLPFLRKDYESSAALHKELKVNHANNAAVVPILIDPSYTMRNWVADYCEYNAPIEVRHAPAPALPRLC